MKNASLLRVSVILTILAGLGSVAITQFVVRPHVGAIIAERASNKNKWQHELARADKLTGDLKGTQEKLASSESALDETGRQLAAFRDKAGEQQRRADTLQQNLDTTLRDLNATQQKLAAWNALGIPVKTVQQVVESEKSLRVGMASLQQDLEEVRRENKRLTGLLASFVKPEETPRMPGVKGTIVAVDPKWSFVVLDVGEKAGAKPRGVFMVSRNGKLIGKVRVAAVHPDRSIANIVQGWHLEDVMEGDQVIF